MRNTSVFSRTAGTPTRPRKGPGPRSVAIDELLSRYALLDERYASDLDRLDFIAEGIHYFEALQTIDCPLCHQAMAPGHEHDEIGPDVRQSARAEATKILAYRQDLAAATTSVEDIRRFRDAETKAARTRGETAVRRLRDLIPDVRRSSSRLDALVSRRVALEAARGERVQTESLRTMRTEIEKAAKAEKQGETEWADLPAAALADLCREIEAALSAWKWTGPGRVEFDQKPFDIIVDGQARQSHGKGVRGVLYAAFAIGLLRYCVDHQKPHPGLVVIDSPLTAYKKIQGDGDVAAVDAGIEAAFWASLPTIAAGAQVIVVENKEPPNAVAQSLHYEKFAGGNAAAHERACFFPT